MRFTLHTDYSLRVLMYLGAEPGDDLATVKEISKSYGISENHLMKAVHRLGQSGFITTVRGRQGGMRLARAPDDIIAGAVVRACEDDMRIVECFDSQTNTCPIANACALPSVLDEASTAFLSVLDRYTLADLLKPRAALWAVLGDAKRPISP
ncbi:MAG: Rrf2 family transcriptional regulator [Alphaproteobacteria bacterium]|nr:Rrf2 family transcriptional regulator [Alphaproteobacteria bacterium]